MAVKDENSFHPVDSLILSSPRRHFRTSIIPIHWQLRSVISSEQGHIVYFPGGAAKRKIIKFNTKTRESETLRVLQFSPRCLVSKNGWLCCGGETGEFVAIRLDSVENSAASSSAPNSLLELFESRLPFSDPSSPSRPTEDALRSILRTLYAQSQIFGKDRVNCITLWFPGEGRVKERAYAEPVAVLANNDKNVIFVTLKESGESTAIDTVIYPDCVNRAVISPDGTLCAAICDDPYLYIHERTKKPTKDGYEWVQRKMIHLKSQRADDKTDKRGSFAVCFNNSGRFLAVGTQYGIISIFDANALLDPEVDPLLTTFGSSRLHSSAGAVREMAFCPGPFDLLAWTEDRGRVGVADIRRNCVSRQILHVDDKDDFEHFDISDKHAGDQRPHDSLGDRYERLLGEGPTNTTEPGHFTTAPTDGPVDTVQAGPGQTLEAEIRRHNFSTTREQLEALEESNRRRLVAARENLASSTGSGSGSASAIRPLREPRNLVTRNDSNSNTSNTVAGGNSNSNLLRGDSLRGLLPPRRVGRLGETAPTSNEASTFGVAGSSSRARVHQGLWAELEMLYNLGFDSDSPDLRRERDILLRPSLNQYNSLREFDERVVYTRHGHAGDDETAGMSWSDDGRTLFVGMENGIYEFHVNVTGRKLLPSLVMR